MMRKLLENKGETLIEALVSLLIAVLAMGLVSTAALSATSINKSTREADKIFADELEAAEIHSTEQPSVLKKLTITSSDAKIEVEENVDVYGKGSTFASY